MFKFNLFLYLKYSVRIDASLTVKRTKAHSAILRNIKNAGLAQLVEQLTLNQLVRGSSPRSSTKIKIIKI